MAKAKISLNMAAVTGAIIATVALLVRYLLGGSLPSNDLSRQLGYIVGGAGFGGLVGVVVAKIVNRSRS